MWGQSIALRTSVAPSAGPQPQPQPQPDSHDSRANAVPAADAIEAPVAVLIHGLGVSHRYFRRLHRELSSTHTVVSLDLPGYGGLPRPPRALSVDDLAAMLIDLFDRRMLRPSLLVGHSMGTQIATEIARRRPDLARTLVLIGPVVNDRRPTVWHQGVDLARDTLLEPLDGNAIVFTDYLRAGPRWYAMELKEMLAYPLRDRLEGVSVPVLVLRGEHDPVGRADWCKRLLTSNSRATLVHVRHGRHLVQHRRAAACADAIRWHEAANIRDEKPVC